MAGRSDTIVKKTDIFLVPKSDSLKSFSRSSMLTFTTIKKILNCNLRKLEMEGYKVSVIDKRG